VAAASAVAVAVAVASARAVLVRGSAGSGVDLAFVAGVWGYDEDVVGARERKPAGMGRR